MSIPTGEVKAFVAQRLVDLRVQAGKTQPEIANYLGVKKTAVSNWERGVNAIDTEYLYRLCEYFGVDANSFFGGFSLDDLTESFVTEVFSGRLYGPRDVILRDALKKLLDIYDSTISNSYKWAVLSDCLDYLSKLERDDVVVAKNHSTSTYQL